MVLEKNPKHSLKAEHIFENKLMGNTQVRICS